jgi:cobalt/nickel transport system ATP-binding protein
MGRVIDARNLAHDYPDGTRGLSNVGLSVEAGERVAVLGANGSGKSTLQLLLGGLLEPSAGEIEYFESTTDAERVRDRLGVLLQDPDDYLIHTTVREDIEYGPSQLGVPRETARDRIASLAADLDLEPLLEKPPFRLSGGEQQRAALASVLSFDPGVLLLDEPVANVDASYRRTVLELLDRRHDAGATLVTFTPDVDLVPHVADRVCLLGQDGRVVADGSVQEVLTDADLLAAHGLEPPAVVRLFNGVVPAESVPLDVDSGRQLLRTLLEDGRAVASCDGNRESGPPED